MIYQQYTNRSIRLAHYIHHVCILLDVMWAFFIMKAQYASSVTSCSNFEPNEKE